MIDNILLYIKLFPSLIKFTKQRIIDTWKWFAFLFIVELVLVLIALITLSFIEIEDISKARWLYRIVAMITFATMFATIFKSFKEYSQDYLITKSFQSTPLITTVANALIGSSICCILSIIILLFKPVNFDASFIAFIVFYLMMILFIIFISVTLGLLDTIYKNMSMIFWLAVVINFFIVPIIFIPSANENLMIQLLKLNPLFYLIDGLATSTIYGVVNMYNISYHIYFILIIVTIGAINFMLMRYVAHSKYKYSSNIIATKNK
ncbi:teichoic acid transporter [Staphylococcus haemolyticus]|uniref:teichoic acid transporter n=1 Tax=Staphylococcus haemolyticus TaxID=1283 RepID=UPI00051DD315|nr:teichoic acid transporter [Staphylococcus haemolyticus]KGJ27173.1 teichoic acid transporter [Staphylococcus haemolyticus]KGJ27876.1 teichoic acid transporter [Staphylococcus haemolyticus]MCH4327723.1 teichoic acid transporter [Staphylococcus haemolyticus]MCH4416475.1 teichoic acid transporter [Staphylococcus haemolyticus]MCH4420654.1 teichoic acid transporter [Staphylococcus haemolyticus]